MTIKTVLLSALFVAASINVTFAQSEAARKAIKLGNELFAKEQYTEAIDEYRKVASSSRYEYAQSIYNIAVCYYELRQTDAAVANYKLAIKLRSGKYPKASFALGVVLEDEGDLSAAEAAYRAAIAASNSKFAPAHYRLGVVLALKGDYIAAARSFRAAMSHSPEELVVNSHNNLGVMLARTGQLQAAETEFAIAVRESKGGLEEANRNLKLCRSLIAKTAGESLAPKVSDVAVIH
jgi:tetratricopeptide (TPR) repeat protein